MTHPDAPLLFKEEVLDWACGGNYIIYRDIIHWMTIRLGTAGRLSVVVFGVSVLMRKQALLPWRSISRQPLWPSGDDASPRPISVPVPSSRRAAPLRQVLAMVWLSSVSRQESSRCCAATIAVTPDGVLFARLPEWNLLTGG